MSTDGADALARMLEYLDVRASGADGEWVGPRMTDWLGEYLFGGFVIAQAIAAATRDAPDGKRLHSMHAYFLRPVRATGESRYAVRTVREGRTVTTRQVDAAQDGKD